MKAEEQKNQKPGSGTGNSSGFKIPKNSQEFNQWIRTTTLGIYIHYFVQWVLISVLIGFIGGLIGGFFSMCVGQVTTIRNQNPWLLYCMPIAGLVIVWIYQITGEAKQHGTDSILEAATSSKTTVKTTTGPVIFIATCLTHLVGGSSGREGAALQIGGWVGEVLGFVLPVKLTEKDREITIMSGMASVFSALFGTPVAAGIFCMEVGNVGTMRYSALLPCLLSAFIADTVSTLIGAEHDSFAIEMFPDIDFTSMGPVIILGILLAILSIFFVKLLHETGHYMKKWMPNPYVRVLVASAIFIGLTLICNTRDYCGSSMALIEESLEGNVNFEAFLLKMIFTAIALEGGFKGGEIIPTLVVGSTFGCTIGTLMGYNPAFMAALGMIGLFAAVTNSPIAAILIGAELFQGQGLPCFAAVVCIAYSLSGYYSLYGSQLFVFDKVHNQVVEHPANTKLDFTKISKPKDGRD